MYKRQLLAPHWNDVPLNLISQVPGQLSCPELQRFYASRVNVVQTKNGGKVIHPTLSIVKHLCLLYTSSRYDMSKTAIIRKALRMYQVIDTRLQKGEKLFMEDEVEKKKSELLVL